MRTSTQAAPLLYPKLADSLVQPLIGRALLPVLLERPVWLDGFLAIAARNGRSAEATLATTAFFDTAEASGLQIAREDKIALVDSLVYAGNYDAAWDYYSSFNPAARRNANRDPDFEAALAQPTSFDWTALDYGSFQVDSSGGQLRYDVPSTIGAVVARQYLLLPPGRYRIAGIHEHIPGGPSAQTDAAPYWRLSCEDGSEVAKVSLPVGSAEARRFEGYALVPADCRFQMLTLVVRPSQSIGGTAGVVRRLSLEPAPRSANQRP